jgi:F-type H+-transporting ATPase subunit delta
MNPGIAARYAKALMMVSQEFEEALGALAKAYEISEVRAFFENPSFLISERLDFIKNLGLAEPLNRCLELMIHGGRMDILPALSKAYTKELDKKRGRVRAQITTSKPLDAAEMEVLAKALGSKLGVTVTPEALVEPRVGAGVRAQIGGLVFDNTLETQFSSLRRDLCN